MKNSKFISGFILAFCLFILISAKNESSSEENSSRYHMSMIGENQGVIYDSFTGEYSMISVERIDDRGNIKNYLGTD